MARAEEFAAAAEAAIAKRHALAILRERITLARRDIAKMIATGVEQGVAADWASYHRTFREILTRLPRVPKCEILEPIIVELVNLAKAIVKALEQHFDPIEPVPPTSSTDRTQNSGPEEPSSSEPYPVPGAHEMADPSNSRTASAIPIRMVVELCPDIVDYARGGIRTPQDLIATASIVRSMLGVSPSAWEEARIAMGDGQASVVLAAILQRGNAIKSPGGYLRILAGAPQRANSRSGRCSWRFGGKSKLPVTETHPHLPSRTTFRKGDPACVASLIWCVAWPRIWRLSAGISVRFRATAASGRSV